MKGRLDNSRREAPRGDSPGNYPGVPSGTPPPTRPPGFEYFWSEIRRELGEVPPDVSDLPEEDLFRERFEAYWLRLVVEGVPRGSRTARTR